MEKSRKQKSSHKKKLGAISPAPNIGVGVVSGFKASQSVKFVVDGMLGSLARKLRILGFDVIYSRDADDQYLHDLSVKEKRVLLTSDRALHYYASKRGTSSIFILEDSDEKRLAYLFTALGLKEVDLDPEESRCAKCNGEIETCSKKELIGIIPSSVLQRHNKFYRCTSCGKTYWKGSHWRRIILLTRRLKVRLKKAGRANRNEKAEAT
ncbi:MAG: Mut7-C RNAse domain-containing protein [Thaumarchaeota archaeon]|nr:Mut7-C RNAse domain-containing protein [Nitrososphaerota archaeon]